MPAASSTRLGRTPCWLTSVAGIQAGERDALDERGTSDDGKPRAIVRCAADIEPEVDSVACWPGRMALGKIALLAGLPGVGKSQLTAWDGGRCYDRPQMAGWRPRACG